MKETSKYWEGVGQGFPPVFRPPRNFLPRVIHSSQKGVPAGGGRSEGARAGAGHRAGHPQVYL